MIEQKKRVMHSLAHIKEDLGNIAKDELKHFELADKLCNYGSQPVHLNLQDRVIQTNDSILGRLAVISIVNEGRGLDTGSNLLQKMDGDEEYENVLKIILKDEVNHVRVDKNPQEEFLRLMKKYQIKKSWKINIQKRKQVGYNDEWIECLKEWV